MICTKRRHPRKVVVFSCSHEILSPSIKIATPETLSAGAFKRNQGDDESQRGMRSDVNCPEYKGKELTARDGCEMCE